MSGVRLHRMGFHEGLVDRIHGVPVRARKDYFSFLDSMLERSCEDLNPRVNVYISVVSEPLSVWRLQAEGGRVDKERLLQSDSDKFSRREDRNKKMATEGPERGGRRDH
jgi:hypothetical protein